MLEVLIGNSMYNYTVHGLIISAFMAPIVGFCVYHIAYIHPIQRTNMLIVLWRPLKKVSAVPD